MKCIFLCVNNSQCQWYVNCAFIQIKNDPDWRLNVILQCQQKGLKHWETRPSAMCQNFTDIYLIELHTLRLIVCLLGFMLGFITNIWPSHLGLQHSAVFSDLCLTNVIWSRQWVAETIPVLCRIGIAFEQADSLVLGSVACSQFQ